MHCFCLCCECDYQINKRILPTALRFQPPPPAQGFLAPAHKQKHKPMPAKAKYHENNAKNKT